MKMGTGLGCGALLAVATLAVATLAIGGQAAAQERDYIAKPVWVRTPSVDDMTRLYPKALHGAVAKGVLDCQLDAAGAFSSCTVTSETPADKGVGEAVLKLSRLFRMKPVDGKGKPVDGRWVTLPVTWRAGFGH